MSSDFRTEHYKGYLHSHSQPPFVHLAEVDSEGRETGGSVSYTLAELTELVQVAGQAWPDDDRVGVRYVLEARRPRSRWQEVWSARADEDADDAVSWDYAKATYDNFQSTAMQWRLLRRTILTVDEVIAPDPPEIAAVQARLEADGARFRAAAGLDTATPGHDGPHDDGLEQDQG